MAVSGWWQGSCSEPGLTEHTRASCIPKISHMESDSPLDVWEAPLPNEDKHQEWESVVSQP